MSNCEQLKIDTSEILILEDHNDFLEMLADRVSQEIPGVRHIHKAQTLTQAKKVLKTQHIGLALLDIHLPDGLGTHILPKVFAANPTAYCVMISSYDHGDILFQSLRQGAKGYILKEEHMDDIIEQLKEMLNGVPPISAVISRKILTYFQTETQPPVHSLTPRELEVLSLLAKGMSRPEIADLMSLSHYTIADYVKSIYQKLDVSSRAEATVIAVKMGLT